MSSRQAAPVSGPRVLVLITHPGIGSAIEALLRMERRYEVRWSKAPDGARWRDWRPELVVVESSLVAAAPPVPRIVLVGDAPAQPVKAGQPRTRWLRKDAPSGELIEAVDAMLGLAAASSRGTGDFALSAISSAVLLGVALLLLRALLR
jgi:hypothetical protein